MAYGLALCTVVLICLGQILFKKSALLLGTLKTPFHLILEPFFLGAIALYGFTTILWIMVLQHLPLGRAYMVMSLSYIFIPLLSFYVFKEPLSIRLVIGAMLIISGVLVALKS